MIESFGEFVIGGNYAVGVVVFIILTIINFVVVTKGAGRISEVSARFTLDAMPGKQMAIDADLNAGLITQDEARARRLEVRAEADFYGSMDGASKFVRGDAIAGILILVINIIGGLAIGMMMHGLPFGDAAKHLHAADHRRRPGRADSRRCCCRPRSPSSSPACPRAQDMGGELQKQLFGQPKALGVAAAMLGVMGLIPGMPNIAFLSIAALCGFAAWRLVQEARSGSRARRSSRRNRRRRRRRRRTQELSWEDVRPVDPLGLEVGYRLVPLVDRTKGGDLLARIRGVRRKLTQELGFLVQAVHIRDNLDLGPNAYRINLAGVPVGESVVHPDRELAINPGRVFGPVERHRDARSGLRHGSGVDRAQPARARAVARLHGRRCQHRHRHASVASHPDACARAARPRRSAAAAQEPRQDRAEAGRRSDAESAAARARSCACCRACSPSACRSATCAPSSRRWPKHAPRTQDPAVLQAQVRVALGRQIVQDIAGLAEELPVITLEPDLERLLSNGLANSAAGPGSRARAGRALATWIVRGRAASRTWRRTGGVADAAGAAQALARFFRASVPGTARARLERNSRQPQGPPGDRGRCEIRRE